MASHLGAIARAQKSVNEVAASVQSFTGCYTARISSIKNGKVFVVLPVYDNEREFGPCVVPIGLAGVGPATVDTTVASLTRPVHFTNAITLQKGLLVLVQFPVSGDPWLLAIAPTGT